MDSVFGIILDKIKHFLHKAKPDNIYTILKFKGKKDFENWTDRRTWQLYASSLEKGMDDPIVRDIVKNIVENIATNAVKKEPGNTNDEARNKIKQQLDNLENNEKATQAKKKIIAILSKVDEKQAITELKVIKKQAEGFIQGFFEDHKKELDKPGTTAMLFVKMRDYITSLEKLADDKILTLLSKQTRALSTKYPNLSDKMNNAMAMLTNNELREFYDKGTQDGTLSPLISHNECRAVLESSKIHRAKEQQKMDNQELEGDLEKVEELTKSVTESISVINKNKQSIFYCINHQNDCIKEMEGKKYRHQYFQRMIDIYQKNIDKYQKEIDEHINPMQKVFDSLSQKIRATGDVKEFKSMIDSLQTKHDTLPSEEHAHKVSTCLVNIRDKIRELLTDNHPVIGDNPATNLSHTKHDQPKSRETCTP